MSVVIYTQNSKQSIKWKNILQLKLPDLKIEIYPDISDFDAVDIFICWKPFEGLIDKFTNLKAIQSLGAGVDHIFEKNSVGSDIQVSKIVDHQLTQDMWEHVLSIVLADMKNLFEYQQHQADTYWKAKEYKRFKDISVGILGLGTIGSYAARHFQKLGFEVMGWSRTKKSIDNVNTFVGNEGLKSLCSNVDYLINILPLTKETDSILNKSLFTKMKSSAYLVNVGRGRHVVDNELIESLDSGIIRGAALDVFQKEPLSESHQFWSHPKIYVTPHVASLTDIDSAYPQIVENIRRLKLGLAMQNLIDVEKGY